MGVSVTGAFVGLRVGLDDGIDVVGVGVGPKVG